MANTSPLKVGVKVPMGAEGEGGSESHLPPWPEWNDAFIKTVPWTGTKTPKKSLTGSYSTSSRRSRIRSIPESDQIEKELLYEDPAGLVEMPEDIPVASWIRPHHTSMSPSYVLEPDVLPLDLLTHNKHLMEYKIMRTIMGSVTCVEREAFHRPFPVEFQSSLFVAPGGSLWRPWHHVYCIGPQIYNLQYNKSGKYMVRLFYLGKWRRLTVDDLLPFDSEGQLLLPTTRLDNLWLPILSKALLRIAALSNGADFSVVHCLTAWLPTSLLCKGCSQYQLWCVCCQLMATTNDITHSLGCCYSQQSISCPPDASVEDLDAVNSRVIFGMILNPTRTVSPAMSISSIESMVLVSNVRYNSERPSPQWKEYRWKEWAFSNGIISDITSMPFRNVQIYNPLRLSELPSPAEDQKLEGTGEEYWLDFELFISVTRVLEVYYKPSYFKYSLRAWSLSELTQKTHCAEDVVKKVRTTFKEMGGKGDAKGKSKSKSPNADKTKKSATVVTPKSPETEKTKGAKGKAAKDKRVSFVEWPLNLNTPSFFYLFLDSMFCKQIYICLSAFNPDGPTYAHIYTGKFEWYSPTVAPLVFMLTTSATAGYTLALSPGLHVFRVWYQFPVHFCLQIFSNTKFTLGSKMYIQQMLSSYSESFQFYGEKICSAFEQLLRAVEGGAEHGSAYSQLMTCLHPPQLREQLVWPQWFKGHTELLQAFEESLTEMLAESTQLPSEMYQVLLSFQMLFLNPVFGEQTLLKVRSEYYDYVQQRRWSKRQKEIHLEEELKQKLAQAGDAKGKKSPKSDKTEKPKKESPRKGSVKSAKTGKQKEGKEKTKVISKREQLKTLLHCKEKSLFLGDYNQAIIMLKKMMTKVPHLKRLYPFMFEDDFRVVFQDYVGEVEVSDDWVVIVRCVMNLHSSEKVPCSLHIWCPLQKMLLRLIDNDTEQDVPLGFVENSVTHLTKNVEGYTLCVYGITDLPIVPWRLRSIGVSETDSLHVCLGQECHDTHIQPLQQFQQTLHGFYVPNKDMLITRCLLEAHDDVTVMLRLSLSNDSVVCSFTIVDEVGNLVLNTSGVGHIIIPVLKLQGKEGSRTSEVQAAKTSSTIPRVYTLEVKLLHNSWPLSLDQRKAMLFYKEHLPDIKLNFQGDSIEEENSFSESERLVEELNSLFFREVDKPSWSLTLVADEQKVMPVSLREDMTLFDQLRELRSKWKEEGKYSALCQELRQDFLAQIAEVTEEDMSEEGMFHLKPNKTEELTQLVGRWASIHSLHKSPSDLRLLHDFKFSRELEDKMSRISLSSQISISLHPLTPKPSQPRQSSTVVSGEQKVEDSINEGSLKVDHRDVLVQQAGINKALTDMRTKNLERLQEVFEQTALLRTQLISEMKAAKEAELKKQKEEKTKSKKSQDKSPDKKTKGQDLNKSKSNKGKGK